MLGVVCECKKHVSCVCVRRAPRLGPFRRPGLLALNCVRTRLGPLRFIPYPSPSPLYLLSIFVRSPRPRPPVDHSRSRRPGRRPGTRRSRPGTGGLGPRSCGRSRRPGTRRSRSRPCNSGRPRCSGDRGRPRPGDRTSVISSVISRVTSSVIVSAVALACLVCPPPPLSLASRYAASALVCPRSGL